MARLDKFNNTFLEIFGLCTYLYRGFRVAKYYKCYDDIYHFYCITDLNINKHTLYNESNLYNILLAVRYMTKIDPLINYYQASVFNL
jgi:hypothetical protein